MSSVIYKRVLVKLLKKENPSKFADFTECILSYFGLTDGSGNVYIVLQDNHLIIGDFKHAGSEEVLIKHPSFCPVLHLDPESVSLPKEIVTRGVDVGVSIILESSDGKILLTRRARNLRIFPGLWVPPGGHMEDNETLLEAGLRELKEETGLDVKPSNCIGESIDLLALWESVYPAKISAGPPVRHHIVVYFHAKLLEDKTSHVMENQINFDPGEVDACAWLSRDIIAAIAQSYEEEHSHNITDNHLPKTFRASVLDEHKKQIATELPTLPLITASTGNADDGERVSTGTKFALQRLVNFQSHML